MYLISAMNQRAGRSGDDNRIQSGDERGGKSRGMRGDHGTDGQIGERTYCPARSDPVAKPNPPHIELIIPALDVEVLTTTVKYTGLSSALNPIESMYVHVKHLSSALHPLSNN